MNWNPTICLKLRNEATLDAVYPPDPEAEPSMYYSADGVFIVKLGTLYNDDAVYDEEGNIITPATPLKGYHADIRLTGELPEALVPFIVTPANPQHRISGA